MTTSLPVIVVVLDLRDVPHTYLAMVFTLTNLFSSSLSSPVHVIIDSVTFCAFSESARGPEKQVRYNGSQTYTSAGATGLTDVVSDLENVRLGSLMIR